MSVLTAKKLTSTELHEQKCQVQVPLASNGRATIFLKITGASSVYIVQRKGEEDFWTMNESQAVAEYNR